MLAARIAATNLRPLTQVPYGTQLALGRAIGRASRRLASHRRRVAEINLALCFPELDHAARDLILRRHFESLGIGLLETAMAWWTPAEKLTALAHFEGTAHLEAALRRGKGVLLLCAHFTTLEIGGRLLSLHIPFDFVYREHRSRRFDAVTRHAREARYGTGIPRKCVRSILGSLGENRVVWYAPDQDYGRAHSVFAPFFGVQAASLTATARLAHLSDACVVPFFPRRLPARAGYRLTLQPALSDFPTDDPVADSARINRLIEAQVRQAPEQYLWVHRRFKTRPEGEPSPYPPRSGALGHRR